tara:strand:- start:259 stop:495 length:237 start_codon:yes stop_codon:yes gene_type:complete
MEKLINSDNKTNIKDKRQFHDETYVQDKTNEILIKNKQNLNLQITLPNAVDPPIPVSLYAPKSKVNTKINFSLNKEKK